MDKATSQPKLLHKLEISFSGKQQGATNIDRKICSPLRHHFCIVTTIFKVATSLSVFSATLPSLAQ